MDIQRIGFQAEVRFRQPSDTTASFELIEGSLPSNVSMIHTNVLVFGYKYCMLRHSKTSLATKREISCK